MRITNLTRLPEPLVSAVSQKREPRPGQISVTELINPPQMRALMLKHWAELTEDASDRIWATMGQLMHKLLEEHARESDEHLIEHTLSSEVEGVTVTGTLDLYHRDGVLTDYKFVSVWTTIDGVKREWEQQLNLYAELLRRHEYPVNRLQIVAIYRDWSKTRAQDASYPQSQVSVFEVPLWSGDEAAKFLEERVRLHRQAESGEFIECTAEERWERSTKYALMKRGRKSAIKLFDKLEEAEAAVTESSHYVETRPGSSIRCDSYCAVSAFCQQRSLALNAAGMKEEELNP
ncbi:MAG: PD-(D/E)XK nuclease family protein [Pyrinomonadaceae bacterium]|nr:PD-(D/E)XK nuclease family protein [Pyrinomonadaceae bacterium]